MPSRKQLISSRIALLIWSFEVWVRLYLWIVNLFIGCNAHFFFLYYEWVNSPSYIWNNECNVFFFEWLLAPHIDCCCSDWLLSCYGDIQCRVDCFKKMSWYLCNVLPLILFWNVVFVFFQHQYKIDFLHLYSKSFFIQWPFPINVSWFNLSRQDSFLEMMHCRVFQSTVNAMFSYSNQFLFVFIWGLIDNALSVLFWAFPSIFNI